METAAGKEKEKEKEVAKAKTKGMEGGTMEEVGGVVVATIKVKLDTRSLQRQTGSLLKDSTARPTSIVAGIREAELRIPVHLIQTSSGNKLSHRYCFQNLFSTQCREGRDEKTLLRHSGCCLLVKRACNRQANNDSKPL